MTSNPMPSPTPSPHSKEALAFQLEKLKEHYKNIGLDTATLTYQDIVNRVADFLLMKKRAEIYSSYGNEAFDDPEAMGLSRFDPIAVVAAQPDSFNVIAEMVEAELAVSELRLLDDREHSIFAYNTLVFGASQRIAKDLPMSEELRHFIAAHLVSPNAPKPKKKTRGQPKHKTDEFHVKRTAIMHAVALGLQPTRNDQASAQISACDAVAEAAKRLYQADGDPRFITGYTFEALKKVWQKP